MNTRWFNINIKITEKILTEKLDNRQKSKTVKDSISNNNIIYNSFEEYLNEYDG